MKVELVRDLSNAFGPSGFEEDVVRVIAKYTKDYSITHDAMLNTYIKRPKDKGKNIVVQLDAHLDECGFMVQSICDDGTLSIVTLGGFHPTNLPAHTVLVRNRKGELHRGIIAAKPVHFMTEQERISQQVVVENLRVDVGTTSREETERTFSIAPGDPIVPEVIFDYNEHTGVCFGKAFDNRVGCACIIDTMDKVFTGGAEPQVVTVVGAFAAQEEVGMRGAKVTAQVVKPDLAIVFEGSPADDFFVAPLQAQGQMKKGAQIRLFDKSYISNIAFVEVAEKVAKELQIPIQKAVRRGGSTNAGVISLTEKAVPTLVIGVPSRYVHSHYNYCALSDLEAASNLATAVIKALDEDTVRHILRQDVLG
ncbi:M42 family metallopeptidase [Veillonella criceti]|uniref:Aminopeptidase ysdC n=1 Tax=Veillonella criceti TaxID=103891 RepID=A0A380NKL8_9FIRM|nr:M20/M25/M40 family metallo-hydrolase [Veillonella criceti]SUP43341.1 Putative aminopeptidase ysdC [Veillonella criceti]